LAASGDDSEILDAIALRYKMKTVIVKRRGLDNPFAMTYWYTEEEREEIKAGSPLPISRWFSTDER
jgi:hypothetical protein